jgi:hypothetical protein
MNDLQRYDKFGDKDDEGIYVDFWQAADEIERLRAENAAMARVVEAAEGWRFGDWCDDEGIVQKLYDALDALRELGGE